LAVGFIGGEPIILYGCEIWGVDHCFKDSELFEHLHIKFIKEILGVHCKATNAACLTELNRYPVRGRIQLATINFIEHILNANNSLFDLLHLRYFIFSKKSCLKCA
jgi:hypothetical protein